MSSRQTICAVLQSTGSCGNSKCRFLHDLYTCDICSSTWFNKTDYNNHFNLPRHLKRARGVNVRLFCPICRVPVLGVGNWKKEHLSGKQHIKSAKRAGLDPASVEPEDAPLPANHIRCSICECVVPSHHWAAHISTTRHKRHERFAALESVLDDAAKDRNGVSVSYASGSLDFGIVEVAEAKTGVDLEIVVQVTDSVARIGLLGVKMVSSLTAAKSFTVSSTASTSSMLRHNSQTRIIVTLKQHLRGHYADRLELSFEDNTLDQRFVIIRRVKAVVGSREEYELLRPRAPYVPQQRSQREPENEVVPGPPPPDLGTVPWVVKLTQAPIPSALTTILESGSIKDILEQLRRTVLPPVLNCDTYGRFWKNAIWIEEHRMEHDLQIYDIEDATLSRHSQLYYLKVPGLAEKRPSVLIGDRILVQPRNAARGKWFEGHVHVVRQAEVGLRFHGSFPTPGPDSTHHVRFKLQRVPLRRQHQALDTAFAAERLLFPKTNHIKPARSIVQRIQPFNALIGGNAPQLAAVKAIVNLSPGSVPFILFGPPGTGKTITLVEAIRQVLANDPSARILACAPSNSAADLITSRLSALGTSGLFRLYAVSRAKDTVSTELLKYTHINRDGHFGPPPRDELEQFRVVVCTCVSASFAHNIGIKRGHFSHVFVDEAGQATEPEVMIALKTIADLKTNVVLAGDPKQLGPIIRSALARRLELDVSYMERLMKDAMYDEHAGHAVTVVKLTKNYRSHEAILKFPNEKFYGGELVPCAEASVRNACLGRPVLVAKTFPVVFHAMSGEDLREASSPSFFNIEEAQQVKAYIEKLRSDKVLKISLKDIGVIAPYHAQCQKIRKLLQSNDAKDVKVGSVEEFQGQERRVIIISTVRSSRDFVEYDLKHTLGFVANPRRFNVAVTRAQALLIVIGDPNVLSLDPLWREFLNYVFLNRGWTGIPISWDPREAVREEGGYDTEARKRDEADMNALADRIQAVALDGVAEPLGGSDANADQPWREVE